MKSVMFGDRRRMDRQVRNTTTLTQRQASWMVQGAVDQPVIDVADVVTHAIRRSVL